MTGADKQEDEKDGFWKSARQSASETTSETSSHFYRLQYSDRIQWLLQSEERLDNNPQNLSVNERRLPNVSAPPFSSEYHHSSWPNLEQSGYIDTRPDNRGGSLQRQQNVSVWPETKTITTNTSPNLQETVDSPYQLSPPPASTTVYSLLSKNGSGVREDCQQQQQHTINNSSSSTTTIPEQSTALSRSLFPFATARRLVTAEASYNFSGHNNTNMFSTANSTSNSISLPLYGDVQTICIACGEAAACQLWTCVIPVCKRSFCISCISNASAKKISLVNTQTGECAICDYQSKKRPLIPPEEWHWTFTSPEGIHLFLMDRNKYISKTS